MSNLFPLELFRQMLGYNPMHFNQLSHSSLAPVSSSCSTVLYQYPYQEADQLGRAQIRAAIEEAELKLRDALGYSVAPHYANADLAYPRYLNPNEVRASSSDADGRWTALKLPEGHVQALGVESLTLIGNANITLSDADADGLYDTFTATIATSVTDPDRIAVYFTSTDRLDSEPAGDAWRIEPVAVSISGGTATVRGRSWLLVKPLSQEGINPAALDPTLAASYVTAVAIYERKTDGDGTATTDAQGVFTWETPPWPSWALCCGGDLTYTDSSTDPASIATTVARVGIRNAKLGLVSPGASAYDTTNAVWNAVSWGTCRAPDRVTLRYLAGLELEGTSGAKQMQKKFQTLVFRLACAELARPLCACDTANRELYRWQQDLARVAKDDELFNLSARDLDCPWGTRRGHIAVWREVLRLHQKRGVSYL